MSPRERISAALRAAPGGEPALVAYLTAGFPRRQTFATDLRALAPACVLIEVGVPFTTIPRTGAASLWS